MIKFFVLFDFFFRFCAVSDELNDKIYMIGGYYYDGKYKSYQYTVSTNSWSNMGNLYRAATVYI